MPVSVLCLFLAEPWVGLQLEIVTYSGHTHFLFQTRRGHKPGCQLICIDRLQDFSLEYITKFLSLGAQWLSGRVLDSRPKGPGFEPHRHHCVVVLEQDTFILA